MSWELHQSGDVLTDFLGKCDASGRAIRALEAHAGGAVKGQLRVVDAATAGVPAQGTSNLKVVQQINDAGAAVNRWRVGRPFSNPRFLHLESFTAGVKIDTDFTPRRVLVQFRRQRPPGPVNDSTAVMFHAPFDLPLESELPLFAFNSAGSGRLQALVKCEFEEDGVTISWSGDESTVTAAAISIAGDPAPPAVDEPSSQRMWSPVSDQLPLDLAAALALQNDNLRAMRDLHYGMDEPVDAPLYSLWANTSAGYVYQLTKESPREWTPLWPLERENVITPIAAGNFSFGVAIAPGWQPRAVLACVEYMIQGDGASNYRDSCSALFVEATSGSKQEQIAVGQNALEATNLAAVTLTCNFGSNAITISKSGGGGSGLASVEPRGFIAWG